MAAQPDGLPPVATAADAADPTAPGEMPVSPNTQRESTDVLTALPAGIANASSFYAFGAAMPNPFEQRAGDPFSCRPSVDIRRSVDANGRMSFDIRRSIDGKRVSMDAMSGIIVHDLLHLTADPRVRQRLVSADSDNDGRISRKDILKVMSSEMSARQKLKWGLVCGAALLVFCLLMLAANAALTYSVVAMSKETSVQTSGVMTTKDGSAVVGTAQTAGVVDLLYAHLASGDAAAALLALKSVALTAADNSSVAVYAVLSATLVPGKRLELVVAAPSTDATAVSAAQLVRLVVDDAGVHEVRPGGGGAAAPGRRLLVAATGARAASMSGLVYDMAANYCRTGPCVTSSAAKISCPTVPTCGANGKAYKSPCEATAAGTTVRCTNCPAMCPATVGAAGQQSGHMPAGMPGNLAYDGGSSYVRTGVASPPPAANNGAVQAAEASPTPPAPKPQTRRPQANRKNPPSAGSAP